jgi:beta-glucanase (GH16 family)
MNTTNRFKLRKQMMLFKCFLLATLFIITLGCSTDETQTVAQFTELVMADEFDTDGALNPAIWGYDIGVGINGWGNQELQYYTDRRENIIVQNGVLIITAKEESFKGSNYTSARILTKGKFEQKYGRFEARIRLPQGKGLWPAFWMLGADIDTNPWPACGEIDIMENAGSKPTEVSGAVHGPGYSGGSPILKKYNLENDRFDTGFHIFGIEWGPAYINYYVDDVLYNQITPTDVPGEWVFDKGPFYIILNVAVGGLFDGPPNAETVFPQTMLVDYVRVYKNKYDNN